MQTIQRPPTGPSRGQSPVRGVVLVAVAVILGIFVLRAMDNTGADVGSVATNSTDTTASGEAGPTETTAPAVRTPAEVILIVANASGVSQAASTKSTQLQSAGYQTVDPTNAPADI